MSSNWKNMSVLLFPWLGHGHISPFLELGKKLNQRNFDIYLCSTPANLSSIKKKIDEQTFSIRLVELNLPATPDLPPPYHTTNGLPLHLMGALKDALDLSEPNFFNILQTLKPDFLIYDFLQPWAPVAASKLNIPAVQFVTSSATSISVLFHAIKSPGIDYPYPNILYRDYENAHVARLRQSVEDHVKGNNPVTQSLERSNKIILIKGFKEIEEKYSDYLSTLAGKKIVPVGPLVQEVNNDDGEDSETIQWLNKKDKYSTVFVSFGSEYFLSNEDFVEIAHGLMLSNVNFIWVVRFPKGENIRVENELPLGFYEMIGDRGIVVEGWAPQAKILGHSSTGGFVSHCGWNSVIESMKYGVPIIAMPMHLDQPLNARLVEEVGAGVEVLRDENGRNRREKIGNVIKQVVGEKSGEELRTKAKELCNKIRMKGDEEIDDVIKELMQLRP